METTITAPAATDSVSNTVVNSSGDICGSIGDELESGPESGQESELEILQKDEVVFLRATRVDGGREYFTRGEIGTELRAGILDGEYEKESLVEVHTKAQDGSWSTAATTIGELAKYHYAIGVLYQPVWARAKAGLKWGAIAGAAIKLADTFFALMTIEPGMAFMFAIAVAVCVIPRIGWMGVAAAIYVMTKYTAVNFFLMGLTSAGVGALLGCFPGMAIGGMIGLYATRTQPTAPDATPETGAPALTAAVLPFATGCALLGFYVFVFNPWLITVLQG